MKIAVTATGNDLSVQVDPRFGRCPWFIVLDPETLEFEAVRNDNADAERGAGIQAAQAIAATDAEAVLTGNCGPNAHRTLSVAALQVFVGCTGTVRQAVKAFYRGELSVADSPNVAGHYGLRTEEKTAGRVVRQTEPQAPPGRRGGRGSGRGMGGGRGRGMGGTGARLPVDDLDLTFSQQSVDEVKENELARLRKQAGELSKNMQLILQRIKELKEDK